MSTPDDSNALRKILGANASDELLELALTHPSAVGEGLERTLQSNQRLEFLGDAIVGAVVAVHWYESATDLPEGELTQRKAAVVQKKSLARAAAKLKLEKWIRVGRGGDAMRGRGREAVLADAFEALVGALFLACGWDAARDFTLRALGDEIATIAQITQTANIKNLLQEYTQANALGTPIYRTQQVGGPAHARQFSSQVLLLEKVRGTGEGVSKKEAECRAAQAALNALQNGTATSS
jgi:ribonuclease-3